MGKVRGKRGGKSIWTKLMKGMRKKVRVMRKVRKVKVGRKSPTGMRAARGEEAIKRMTRSMWLGFERVSKSFKSHFNT